MLFKNAQPSVPAQAVEALTTDPQNDGTAVTLGVIIVELEQVPKKFEINFTY